MGAEQSSTSRSSSGERRERSQAQIPASEVQRMLEVQRQNYERRCQEIRDAAERERASQAAAERERASQAAAERERASQAAAAAAVNSVAERTRTPYQYVREELHAIREHVHPPQRPSFNYQNTQGNSSSSAHVNYNNNNPFTDNQRRTPQDFVFVNNACTAQRSSPAPSAPAPPAPRNRPRSVSRNRVNGNPEDKELYCPTCQSLYNLTIYQCRNGHSSCSSCKVNGQDCGICGQNITTMRNYVLEEYIAKRKVACPNKSSGCKLYIAIANMDAHVGECPFKEQSCPLQAVFHNCDWKGKLEQISKHFNSVHPTQHQTDVDTEMKLTNLTGNSQELHLVVLGVYNFLFHLKVSAADQRIYMTVQLIGTKMSAKKWFYEINVFKKSENRRKYAFTDICSSSSESVQEIFNTGNCAVLPVSYANTFVNEGAMSFKFFIKKTNEGKKC